jgi:PAS domain S-box-containing protein
MSRGLNRVIRPRLSLRWRIVLLVLFALVPAVLLLLDDAHRLQEQLVAAAEARALRLARVWAQNHDALVREAELLIEAARRDPTVEGLDPERCSAALRSLAESAHWPSELLMVDNNGIVRCASESDSRLHLPPQLFLDELFSSHRLNVSEFQLDPAGRSIAFAGIQVGDAPQARHALVAAIDLAEIQRRTASEAEGAPYNIMVIARTGRILARDPEQAGFVGTPIGDHPLMPDLMVKTEGSAVGRGRDGVERFFAFTQLPLTGAKVSVGLARQDILGAQQRDLNRRLGMIGVVALAILIGAWLIGEFSLVRWARMLGRSADAFARGDFTHRAAVHPAAGEFAALADAFNRMARTVAARTAALAESERRFRDIAEVAGDFFWESDVAGRFTFLSERFTEVTGIGAAEIIGRSGREVIALASDGEDARQLALAFRACAPFRDLTLSITLRSGEARWWRLSGSPFFDEASGAFRGFRGAGSEVTAVMRAARELREAKEAAEAASTAKSEFLATMSHELRTPLNAVIGFSEIMHKEVLGPVGVAAYRDYAGDILHSGQHLLAMINDILDFAKIDAGQMRLIEAETDLLDIARRAARAIEPQATAAGIAVALTAEEPALPVWGDERRLRQVLLNLVSNAVKFTPEGGKVAIELGRTAADEARIVVRDTGIGIASEDLPRVVEPFRQVDSGHARRHEGTGLGLAICERLVRLHGGTLRLESQLGAGTVVTIILPRERSVPGRHQSTTLGWLQSARDTAAS